MSHSQLQSKKKFNPRDYQVPIIDVAIDHCRASNEPAFVEVSVGGGKTALYAFIADHVASKGGKVMVLARQGELVEQNSDFGWKAGIKNSIYSASLKQKNKRYPVVYASEGTVARAIGEGGDFGVTTDTGTMTITPNWKPDLLLIDECHQVNYEDPDCQYMKVIKHFMRINPKLRIIGGTGSPIRGKKYIVGDFWKKRLYELSTQKLVEWGWLVPPIFGFPEDEVEGYDFSSIEVDKDNDSFSDEELNKIVLENPTKTQEIITEIVAKTKDRLGVLIFCSTKKHCQEAVKALPKDSYGIISDDTPFKERSRIYKASRKGAIKYLVNVGVLATGYNNPRIDTVCYLRPLDSLTLLIQTMGRGFRIPEEQDDFEKTNCLVLDYGDVFTRLGDLYENPILEEGLKQSAKKKQDVIPCPKCGGDNSPMARRCSNTIEHLVIENNEIREENKRRRKQGLPALEYNDERCDFFFSSRDCPDCGTQNDPCARQCRKCGYQLIDPNKKLSRQHYTEKCLINVNRFEVIPCRNEGLLLKYYLENDEVATEFFSPFSQNQIAKRIYRATFVKQHIQPQHLRAFGKLRNAKEICESGFVMPPKQITHRLNDNGKSVINRKVF